MIQRLQTVYLFGIIILALITCTGQIIDYQEIIPAGPTSAAPADSVNTGKAVAYTLNAVYFNTYVNGTLHQSEIQFVLILMVSAIAGWTLNIIFGYKNRKRQMTHTKLNFVVIGAYFVTVIVKAFTMIPNFTFANMTMKASIGLALVIFMLYLNLRALLLMRRDDDLVKSADRLR